MICGIPNSIAEIDPQEVYSRIGEFGSRFKTFVIEGISYEMDMSKKKFKLFRDNPRCPCCGIEGTRMFLCKDRNVYSFNLYAESEGELILMTLDHIQPQSKGGSDSYENLRTMCYPCNNFMQDSGMSLETMRKVVKQAVLIQKRMVLTEQIDKELALKMQELNRNKKMIEHVNEGLLKTVNEDARQAMLKKIKRAEPRVQLLKQFIRDYRVAAVRSGKLI